MSNQHHNLNLSPTPFICLDPSVHFGTAWRDPIGKVLTNRKINEYALLGRYGPQQAEKARAKVTARTGVVYRCECGRLEGVRFLKFAYLPKPAWYCKVCLSAYQKQRDQEEELKSHWLKAARVEYC